MREIRLTSSRREELIDITDEVQNLIDEENIRDGFAMLYVPHTTAAVTINKGADSTVQEDIKEMLSRLIPRDKNYHHLEGNSDAHIKAGLLGVNVNVLVKDGKLMLGTWQHIFSTKEMSQGQEKYM